MFPAIPLKWSAFLFLLLSVSLLHAQPLAPAVPEAVGFSSERLAFLTSTMQGYVDEGALPGSVMLIARHGRIAYFESFGSSDLAHDVPMEKDAIFRIASQTKALVSVGIMMLQEEGRLLITDPLGKYLPAFAETTVAVPTDDGYEVVKANRPITLRDLLTHSAGISYGYGPAADRWREAGIQGWYFADREEPIQATVNRMAGLPFDAQPGEQFVYGYNTDILGAVVEVVSGQPLDAFLRERLLDPLCMTDTYFYLPPEKADRLTVVYSPGDDGLEPAPAPGGMVGQGAYVDGPRQSFSGGAGLLSTTLDYARFLQMMLDGGQYNGRRFLSRKTVELMTTPHLPDEQYTWVPGVGFGLGFSVVENLGRRGELGSVGEFGWGGAYHSVYWADPVEDLIVVYFTQLIPNGGLDDHAKLRALIYQALVD
ncbi:MAG: beta-lactamase family protein [Lewinella sp.]|nr:beta-lactamase family protein [Lewinella sp.]